MEDEDYNQQTILLEALKDAAINLKPVPIPFYSTTNFATIETILQLETQLNSLFSNDPIVSSLLGLLTNLKTQFDELRISQGYSLRLFYHRQIANYEVSKIATSIEAQVKSWIDQESIKRLVQVLLDYNEKEEKLCSALLRFRHRLSSGFDGNLQELILKSKLFPILESTMCDSDCSKRVREQSARAIVSLVEFNKDVFVGQVLMGNTIEALVSMASCDTIQVLTSLIKLIKTPLVYEMEENDYIPKISSHLSSKDLSNQLVAMECVLELAYFARKEAIEAMLEEGLINKLLELQRLEIVGDSNDEYESNHNGENKGIGTGISSEMKNECTDTVLTEYCPFTSCVTRFVRKIEMGEGLEKEEKREMKLQILRTIREASGSELEATSIISDVLWGSSLLVT